MNDCSILDIFNVEGIDVEELSLINDRNLLDNYIFKTTGVASGWGLNYVDIEFNADKTYLIDVRYTPYDAGYSKGTNFSLKKIGFLRL